MATCGDEVGPILFGDFFDTAPATVTGTMAVTEGVDTFSASGDVFVVGAMAASESGADTFAASGDVFVKGALAATEAGSDTFTASGDVFVTGSMVVTEASSDVAAISGAVLVQGAMAVVEVGEDIANFSSSAPVVTKKRGGTSTRKTSPPKHIISTVESDDDRARAIAEIMADEPEQPVIAETPQVATTFTPQILPVVDLAPVIAAAQQAIEIAAQGAALQVAALESARLVALQAEREETARRAAQAILEARLRDEDEATALIFIMATA